MGAAGNESFVDRVGGTGAAQPVNHVTGEFNDTIGVYGEGLGGYVVFYLALAHARSAASCANETAVVTEPVYHRR